jgi:DNA-binding MarR family transcriptional regulator
MRRGAGAVRVREYFYGSPDSGALDLALADALSLVCLQGPLRMGELADAMHITPASTTRAVNCLVDKGLVDRVRDDEDQRSIQVEATEEGRERYAQISARIQSGLTLMLSEFSEEEQLQMADYLERFVASIDRLALSAGDE